MSYEYSPALPWGHWMRVIPYPTGAMVRDDEGREWGSVREALWYGRLGMSATAATFDGMIEMLLAVLASHERRTTATLAEATLDLFAGSPLFYTHYTEWLQGAGMLQRVGMLRGRSPFVAFDTPQLTAEGRAVMLMLAATRAPELRPFPLGHATVVSMSGTQAPDRGLEDRLEEADRAAAALPFRFCRETLFGLSCIALIGERLGWSMPMTRTIWSVSFDDAQARDRLHGWLCDRMDRWEAWGSEAYKRGGAYFSQQLLSLIAADMPIA